MIISEHKASRGILALSFRQLKDVAAGSKFMNTRQVPDGSNLAFQTARFLKLVNLGRISFSRLRAFHFAMTEKCIRVLKTDTFLSLVGVKKF
jgi:hypothetical protein